MHRQCVTMPACPLLARPTVNTGRVPGTSLHYKPSGMRIPAGRSAAQAIQPPVWVQKALTGMMLESWRKRRAMAADRPVSVAGFQSTRPGAAALATENRRRAR